MPEDFVAYLDNAATTQIDPLVQEGIMMVENTAYGNPGSLHRAGRAASHYLQRGRESVATMLGRNVGDIIFTSGGSEANNLAILGLARRLKEAGETHIITSEIEHDSVLNCMKKMCDLGFSVTYLKPDEDGHIQPGDVYRAITAETGLVSIMAVNNETGAVQDIEEIGMICKSKDVILHSDCVQAPGIGTDIIRDVDMVSLSAHKFHGPKGVGALCSNVPLDPVILGGHQEGGLRAGTENVAGIYGMGLAAERLCASSDLIYEKMRYLHDAFIYDLVNYGVKFKLNGHTDPENLKIINLQLFLPDGRLADGETLLLMLDERGVCVSAGSACTAHNAEPSHVLMAMGLTEEEARASLRFSLTDTNTREEITYAVQALRESLEVLSSLEV